MRLAGVLHHGDAAAAGDRHDGVEVCGRAAEVHRDHRARARCDRRFDLAGVDLKSVDVAVYEDRQRVHQQHGIHRSHERVGRDDHLVSGTDAERGEGCDEGAGAVGCSKAPLRPGQGCVRGFERGNLLAAEPLAAPDDRQERVLFSRVGDGPGRKGRPAHWGPAEHGRRGGRRANRRRSGRRLGPRSGRSYPTESGGPDRAREEFPAGDGWLSAHDVPRSDVPQGATRLTSRTIRSSTSAVKARGAIVDHRVSPSQPARGQCRTAPRWRCRDRLRRSVYALPSGALVAPPPAIENDEPRSTVPVFRGASCRPSRRARAVGWRASWYLLNA